MPGAVSIGSSWSGLQSYTTGHHPEAMAYTLGRAVRLEARAITAHSAEVGAAYSAVTHTMVGSEPDGTECCVWALVPLITLYETVEPACAACLQPRGPPEDGSSAVPPGPPKKT